MPVLLYLRDHVTAIASTPDVALPELVRGTLGRYRADEPDGWFEQRLHDGDCLVLLDGLDEVARPEDRRGVASWVERQVIQYPKNDYVITSRPQGYLTARRGRTFGYGPSRRRTICSGGWMARPGSTT